MSSDSETPQLPLGKPEPPPPPAFAGFLQRLAAFVIDLILIYFVGYTLEMAARAPLLKLGPFLPFLSHVFAFSYFWLGNGPVGKGMTLGKAVLNLRTVDKDAKPLAAIPALRRALLQDPFIFPAVLSLLVSLSQPPVLVGQVVDLVELLCQAQFLTLGYSVLMHPRRQGWHDQTAESFVTADPPPVKFREAMETPIEPDVARRATMQRKMNAIFLIIFAAAFGAPWVMTMYDKNARDSFQAVDKIDRDFPVSDYDLIYSGISNLPANLWPKFREYILQTPDAAEIPTEISGSALILPYVKRYGNASISDGKNQETARQIEKLRTQATAIMAALPKSSDAPTTRPQHFVALFADQFKFVVFYPGSDPNFPGLRPGWAAYGPIDPALGPLRYERLAAPEKKPGEAATRK